MPLLIVITGPTAVGKTAVSIELAEALRCEIINADSRQIFREIPICTAAPTAAEQARVRHHFVGVKSIVDYYSASRFEDDVLALLPTLWRQNEVAVMCGGSMMYVDAVCRGIDPMPDVLPEVRKAVKDDFATRGHDALLNELQALDPEYFSIVDRKNPRRVMHAVELCRQTGSTYTSLRRGEDKKRPFRIVKIGLNLPREQLFERINRRVDAMIEAGLEDEARSVFAQRQLTALNTVGMKEMFAYFDGSMPRETAVERIKKNTRVYAKKQLTWLARDEKIRWIEPKTALNAIKRGDWQLLL